jgi:transcriptional regulator NrdR family protein
MKCPTCGAWSRVLSTRNGTLRRRECANTHRFTTLESVVAQDNVPRDTNGIRNQGEPCEREATGRNRPHP